MDYEPRRHSRRGPSVINLMLDYPDELSLAVAFLYLSPTFLGTSGGTSNIFHCLSTGHLSRTSISMRLQEAPYPTCKVYPDAQPQLEISTHGDCFGSSMAILTCYRTYRWREGLCPYGLLLNMLQATV
jgi:hypothetical protein